MHHLTCLSYVDCPFESPLTRLGAHDWAAALLSDGGERGRFSYLIPKADETVTTTPTNYAQLQAALAGLEPQALDDHHPLGPFSGGVIGMAAFELGLRLESLDPSHFRLDGGTIWPELVLLKVSAGLAFDHHKQKLFAFARATNQSAAALAAQATADFYLGLTKTEPITGPLGAGPMIVETAPDVHAQKIAALVQKIHAGELFQANLAQGWGGRLLDRVTPSALLAALSSRGAAPFAALLRFDNCAIVSNSPERFIYSNPLGQMQTRPIKGTRKRGKTEAEDQALAQALLSSEKDHAENLMIVDLMRNDLGRISETGSVAVPKLCDLETYSNVHHLVSVVTAQMKAKTALVDLLTATLPAGSISGAPKVQAMKVISQMEAPRGPYCGIIFYQDVGGGFDSSVLIRTLALEETSAGWIYRCAAGGGIVADSDPHDETAETEIKISLIRSVIEDLTA